MHNRTVCTCVASPHYGWACAFSGVWLDQMDFRILHICVLFPRCGWSCASSTFLLRQMISYILSKYEPSFHCGWMNMCVFRCAAWPNDLWHWTQVYFLSLLWVSMCIFRFPAWLNDFSHSAQVCLFTPLWVSMFLGSLLLCLLTSWIQSCLLFLGFPHTDGNF